MAQKDHHRNYPYRPPRRVVDVRAAGYDLLLRFMRTYLMPHKWAITGCIILVSLNACSVYLMAYYGRIVIDQILVVRPPEPHPTGPSTEERVTWTEDRLPKANLLPSEGLGRRIDRGWAATSQPPGAGMKLMVMFIVYLGTLLILNYLARVAESTRIRIGQEITGRLREDMHEKVLDLSLSYHKAHTPGRLLARIMSDVEIVQQQMLSAILLTSRSVVMILTGFIILVVSDWRMAAIVLAMTPAYAVVHRRARTGVTDLNREIRHTNSCMYGLVSQKLDGVKAIQAYNREGLERLNFNRLAACFLRDALVLQRLGSRLNCQAEIIGTLATGSIFLFGTWLVIEGNMTLGQMMYVYGIAANLFGPVLQFTQLSMTMNNLLVVLQRVGEVMDEPVEIKDAPDAVAFPSPVRQGISLQHVGFRYSSGIDTEPVLREVSIDVPAGTWLCVIGASGAGKTTLLYLLARLYEPTSGQIRVDGIPLPKVQMDSLRQRVGFVPQESQIFRGTVRDNICYGFPDATPQQIMTAAKAAEIHDFIMDMPVKYETLVGEKGISLSGGQRQRLSLARALLTNPDVLILDDCTSALDADTERRVQTTLSRILVGKTAVVVTQRVSMARRCHRICTIENGVISEIGTHAQLVKAGGFYSRLHAQQTE